ncbi:sensor histidine kinase [Flavobacterium sp. MFBS3-15]|uniref:sensor histidine kinase n=1 Tax=Flavobacterium sp. MFBS3-15 TaxID=2989816 RepID=UPI00223598D0|nr:sensor histidine kinase [Flavobacterium sp. MFBS3-15]MCW4467850.1 sensor histidine kinase [Flavobacterium sp. MFBS3-15]
MNLIIILPAMLLCAGMVYSQHTGQLEDIESDIAAYDYKTAKTSLERIVEQKLTKPEKAYYNYLFGKYYDNNNHEELAYNYYLKSKALYNQIDSTDRAMEINYHLAFLLSAQEKNKSDYQKYLNEYMSYGETLDDPKKLGQYYARLATFSINSKDYKKGLGYFKKAKNYLKIADNPEVEATIDVNLASLYINDLNKPDSALYYLKKNLAYLNSITGKKRRETTICHNFVNQAAAYYYLEDYKNAITSLKKADSVPIKGNVIKNKQYIYEFLYTNYEAAGDYPNAYKFLILNKKFSDSAKTEEQNIAINDIQVKYRTKEKELENIKLKNKNKTKTILLYTFTGLLIAGIAIGWLILKNARRREKISRQEKLIEQQKLEKALKDYELHSIDLMLEGQEKERQRIANDLHDNLGSMLATLKINFENLKLRKNGMKEDDNRLYDKTDELIEEAYQKVRRLAHAKNAGVFANEGLIPAINKLAKKVSVPENLSIQVSAFGFNDRLENTIEITIFRMVQELTTNIVKHSKATEAEISLTHHDENINIMIEDNGIGMNAEKTKISDGMGLDSIKKKVAQLGGQFNIDSKPHNGTTIIIDLPI